MNQTLRSLKSLTSRDTALGCCFAMKTCSCRSRSSRASELQMLSRFGYFAVAAISATLATWKLMPVDQAITFKLVVMVPLSFFLATWGMRTYFRAASRRDAGQPDT